MVALEVLNDADVVTVFKPDYTAATAMLQDQLGFDEPVGSPKVEG